VPSRPTVPFTSPAVAVSTFCPAGVPAGAPGSADVLDASLFPPHATIEPASARPSAPAQTFRRRIETLLNVMNLSSQLSYISCVTGHRSGWRSTSSASDLLWFRESNGRLHAAFAR